nr:MarC family protein [uncultured Holophaga sp.]
MPVFLQMTLYAFLALFPILSPPTMAPIFHQVTNGVTDRQRHRLAFLVGLYTFFLLAALLFVGGWILRILGITVPPISIAGGILLFHSAWRMLNKDAPRAASDPPERRGNMLDKAFFPITLPMTAGPGSIAVTLAMVPEGSLLGSGLLLQYLARACGIFLAALSVWLFYRFSGPFFRRLSRTGEATINQLSAFVLLAIGVQIIWNGLRAYIGALGHI